MRAIDILFWFIVVLFAAFDIFVLRRTKRLLGESRQCLEDALAELFTTKVSYDALLARANGLAKEKAEAEAIIRAAEHYVVEVKERVARIELEKSRSRPTVEETAVDEAEPTGCAEDCSHPHHYHPENA